MTPLQPDERICASCGARLDVYALERDGAVCTPCDLHLDREIACWLEFVATCQARLVAVHMPSRTA